MNHGPTARRPDFIRIGKLIEFDSAGFQTPKGEGGAGEGKKTKQGGMPLFKSLVTFLVISHLAVLRDKRGRDEAPVH